MFGAWCWVFGDECMVIPLWCMIITSTLVGVYGLPLFSFSGFSALMSHCWPLTVHRSLTTGNREPATVFRRYNGFMGFMVLSTAAAQ